MSLSVILDISWTAVRISAQVHISLCSSLTDKENMAVQYYTCCLYTAAKILQSVQREPFHQEWVMDHVRHVQLTVRGLGLV